MTYDKSRFISAPWGGWVDSLPSMLLKANSFRQITNILLNQGRIQPFPNLIAFTGPPDGNPIIGGSTFTDVLGNTHTFVVTRNHFYYLTAGGTYTVLLDPTSGAPFNPNNNNQPLSVEIFTNKAFFANGNSAITGSAGIAYIDGGAYIQSPFPNAPGTSFFLTKLAGSLVQGYLYENNQFFPQSVRWSAINSGLQWDFTQDPTAGSALIPEIEDQITGMTVQRGQGVIYRNHGITIMSPTGSLLPRFSFSSYATGITGVGVFFAYTLGNFGDESCFVAEDDIYCFSHLSDPIPIGKGARKAIYNDLAGIAGFPAAKFLGSIGPVPYKAYWLAIPQNANNSTSLWIYHFDDQTWVNEQLPAGKVYWFDNVSVS